MLINRKLWGNIYLVGDITVWNDNLNKSKYHYIGHFFIYG